MFLKSDHELYCKCGRALFSTSLVQNVRGSCSGCGSYFVRHCYTSEEKRSDIKFRLSKAGMDRKFVAVRCRVCTSGVEFGIQKCFRTFTLCIFTSDSSLLSTCRAFKLRLCEHAWGSEWTCTSSSLGPGLPTAMWWKWCVSTSVFICAL